VAIDFRLTARQRELQLQSRKFAREVLARALVEPVQPIEWAEEDERAAEPPVHPQSSETGTAVRH